MNIEDKVFKVLKLLKEKPLLMTELEKELQLSTDDMLSVMAFFEKYKLLETMASSKHELMAKITERGRQLLHLPNLPEDESTTSDDARMLQRFETAWAGTTEKDKTICLYTSDQQVESNKGIAGMAKQFNITNSDVIHAMWLCARSDVWAKLERDLKAKHRFFAITPPLVSDENEASKQ